MGIGNVKVFAMITHVKLSKEDIGMSKNYSSDSTNASNANNASNASNASKNASKSSSKNASSNASNEY